MHAQRNAGDGCDATPRLALSADQRDGLLYVCDIDVDGVLAITDADEETRPGLERMLPRMPVATALADDLVLPTADGRYEIRSVSRGALVQFLEHQLNVLLEEGQFHVAGLRAWHTCVTLLDALGHRPEGSIYDGVACHCDSCEEMGR